MTSPEFIKQPRGGYAFDIYAHPTRIPSPLGDFTVELQMDIGEKAAPSDEMASIAARLVAQFIQDCDQIAEMVFKQYLMACEDDSWMDFCDVETGLSQSEFVKHLNGCSLTVSHERDEPEAPYQARVSISPDWDEEHGLYLMHDGERWVFVDC